MAQYAQEERQIREENLRLQRRLQLEMERRENLCRHLSESESSLEMDDERWANVLLFIICNTYSLIIEKKFADKVYFKGCGKPILVFLCYFCLVHNDCNLHSIESSTFFNAFF